ncbi:guanylate-binding protein 4-like [Octodon degus]|uniref:Guanylate-binding protein 4-like n=1 Tax=Octodon degus TaxID=10160 RepID=A0A6P3EIV4_OCTDE|nr:guanylate-binding protein 4-like [Octodon degus]
MATTKLLCFLAYQSASRLISATKLLDLEVARKHKAWKKCDSDIRGRNGLDLNRSPSTNFMFGGDSTVVEKRTIWRSMQRKNKDNREKGSGFSEMTVYQSRCKGAHLQALRLVAAFSEGDSAAAVLWNWLGALVESYVKAINSGAVPCLENAVTTLAQRENAAAVQKAAAHYSEQMAQRVRLPTDTLQELLDVHAACEKEAIAVFMESSFKDENQEFQEQLVSTVERKKEDFLLQNEAASTKYCQDELEQLSASLMEDISEGIFSAPGGHRLYLEARRRVEEGYKRVPRKGVKANEVLQSFLQSQATIENSLLQSDKALTDGEKKIEAERAKREAAEKEQELLRQKNKEQQEKMEAQERSFQENVAQLKKKMDEERENILREQEIMLEHKLKVQREFLMDGFKKQSEALNREIEQLTQEIKNTKSNKSFFSKILDTAGTVFMAVLPGAGKGIGLGMKFLSSQI